MTMNDRDRLAKVLTLAMHPQTIPQEALAAFHAARELVKANQSLAHPPTSEPSPPKQQSAPESTFEAEIVSVHPNWALIIANSISRKAYALDLKHKIEFDLRKKLVGINLIFHGSRMSCEAIEKHLHWTIDFVNEQIENSGKG